MFLNDYRIDRKIEDYYDVKQIEKYDSLVVLVDSLRVQIDSLHPRTFSDSIIFIRVPEKIDTALIIDKYFKSYQYKISHLDSDLKLDFNFLLSQNKLIKPQLKYQILRPTILKNYSSKGFYAGAGIRSNFQGENSLLINGLYTNKSWAIGLGFTPLDKNKMFHFSYYKKLW